MIETLIIILYKYRYQIICETLMNPDEIDKLIKNSVERLKNLQGFEKVNFIVLYGSSVEGVPRAESDIDLCIDIDADTEYERSCFRLKILSELSDLFDVQIFEQLPLYVKKEVIKGKVIFAWTRNIYTKLRFL